MRQRFVVLTLVLVLALTLVGCSSNTAALTASKDPAKIAETMWGRYQDFCNGETTFADFYYTLQRYSSEEIFNDLQANRDLYKEQLLMVTGNLRQENIKIVDYEVSDAFFNKEKDLANVFRIQHFNNGQKLYFMQTFALQDGQWKMIGDQMTPPFDMAELKKLLNENK